MRRLAPRSKLDFVLGGVLALPFFIAVVLIFMSIANGFYVAFGLLAVGVACFGAGLQRSRVLTGFGVTLVGLTVLFVVSWIIPYFLEGSRDY